MMLSNRLLICLAALFLFYSCGSAQKKEPLLSLFEPWSVIKQADFGDYVFELGYTVLPGETIEDYYFQLSHRGTIVVQERATPYVSVVDVRQQGFLNRKNMEPVALDITGDGVPELVIEYYTGGAHCCFNYYIYSLADELKRIDLLETADAEMRFVDYGNDGIYELEGVDATFAYWQASFADSPMSRVVLKYTPDGYILDTATMRKEPMDAEIFENAVLRARSLMGNPNYSSFQDAAFRHAGVPPMLWEYMLDFIYSGNAPQAWDFLDRVWLKGVSGKEAFHAAFMQRLKTSPYWNELKIMNGLPD